MQAEREVEGTAGTWKQKFNKHTDYKGGRQLRVEGRDTLSLATEVTTATEGWRVVIERGEQTRSWVSIKSRGLGTGVQSPLPEQPPRMLFLPAAHASACDMVSPGRFIRDSVPRVLLGKVT